MTARRRPFSLFGPSLDERLALLKAAPAVGAIPEDTARALDEAARLAGTGPLPAYVVDTPLPNAFVLRTRRAGAIGVTTGFTHLLSAEEQRAVLVSLLLRKNPGAGQADLEGAASEIDATDLAAARLLDDPVPLVSGLQTILSRDHCLWWADLGPRAYVADESPFLQRPAMSERVARLRAALGLTGDAAPPPTPQPPYGRDAARSFLAAIDPGYSAASPNAIRYVDLPEGVNMRVWMDAVVVAREQGEGPDIVIPEVIDRLGGETLDLLVDVISSQSGARIDQPAHRISQQERSDRLRSERPWPKLSAWWRRRASSPAGGGEAVRVEDGAGVAAALDDMCLAAGVKERPSLSALDVPALNACLWWSEGRPALTITSGLTAALTPSEQRAVFAYLLARLALATPASDEELVSVDPAVAAADLQAVRFLGDPAPLLSALTKVLASAHEPPDGWEESGAVWFCDKTPLDAAVRFGEHPRVRRLREVLGAAGAS